MSFHRTRFSATLTIYIIIYIKIFAFKQLMQRITWSQGFFNSQFKARINNLTISASNSAGVPGEEVNERVNDEAPYI